MFQRMLDPLNWKDLVEITGHELHDRQLQSGRSLDAYAKVWYATAMALCAHERQSMPTAKFNGRATLTK